MDTSRTTGPPVPSVLVVGDFRSEALAFARRAWDEVVAMYWNTGDGVAQVRQSGDIRQPTLPDVPVRRDELAALFPVRLSDAGNAQRPNFAAALYENLQQYDVWGIVSCGTAESNHALVSAADFVGVPIFVTVDNTLNAPPSSDMLRLVPSNERQAQAIVNHAAALNRGRTDLRLFGLPETDRYVQDLYPAIRDHANSTRLQYKRIVVEEDIAIANARTVVVCVGYPAAFQKLLKWLPSEVRTIIACDGCYDSDEVRDYARANPRVSLYWTRSTVDTVQYAGDAYRVLCEVFREVGRLGSFANARGLSPAERLVSVLDLCKRKLETQSPYKFRSWENQRGGYVIERVQ